MELILFYPKMLILGLGIVLMIALIFKSVNAKKDEKVYQKYAFQSLMASLYICSFITILEYVYLITFN